MIVMLDSNNPLPPPALATDEALAAAQTFYEDMGTLALEKKCVVLS